MKKLFTPEEQSVIEAVRYRPAISIIMPFDPKMGHKTALVQALHAAAGKVETELQEQYPDELSRPVMEKLRKVINDLNFNTHKKSIAIFVSPVFEKVLYLDIAVEERVVVDGSFEIRDLVFSKKQLHKYLVLLLSSRESRMFLGNSSTFIRILSSSSESADDYKNDISESAANFSDVQARKEIVMDKFLRHIDNSLSIMLNAYPLPLFILGTERIAGHFKKITKHSAAVIDYIPGNYQESSVAELQQVLEPNIADWRQVMQTALLKQLDDAAGNKKLATGMQDVWRQAAHQNGRLLAVEKNYMYAGETGSNPASITPLTEPYNRFSYIKDAVDDVIEKVLESGGDVEFTDEGVLKKYGQIALVQFY